MHGLLELSTWGYVAVALALTHLTIVSVTVYLHRHQAHRALDLHPVVAHAFRFWLWLTTGMVTKEWAAVHRKHHARCEGPEDPHSPQVAGIWRVLFGGALLYRREAQNRETLEKYGRGTPDDWLERRVYGAHPALGILLMLAVNVVLFGAVGLLIWLVQMVWIPFWAAGVINGVGHYFGYRNYECPDASRNIFPWGILIGGEELHNNHHTYASSAKLSSKWYEFDIGWMYIRLLETVGLARVKKVAPKPAPLHAAQAAQALLANRFQLMAQYARHVVARVHRDELREVADPRRRSLLRRARRLLVRDETLLDERRRARLAAALADSPRLEAVYRYKEQLQGIWRQSARTQEQRLNDLLAWCREAERSGVRALQEFAQTLRAHCATQVGTLAAS
ncbi:transposase [Ectothiorhodospiraceae bacterium 2226]|nr:transposase [Ectothiorhodospiraceae bacterium 2226]